MAETGEITGAGAFGEDGLSAMVAAGSAACGADLADPVVLAGSGRSTVLRCRSAAGGTVIVKSYPPGTPGDEGFTAEAAGLALAGPSGLAPRLLGTDRRERLVVMTDLGKAPSLADVLLGGGDDDGVAALRDWARAAGELAVRTAGREADLAGLTSAFRLRATGSEPAEQFLVRRIREAADLTGQLGIERPAGLNGELARAALIAQTGEFDVFSPGDICPDNSLLTADGARFIDFESAGFHNVFLDAAYLRMPFSTCWCVFRLPDRVAADAEASYRQVVAGLYPRLADDAVWRLGIRRAAVAWTLHAMTYLLDHAMGADAPVSEERTPVPTRRQLLRYRWEWLAAELDAAHELPAVRELVAGLLRATSHWRVPPMPVYPAFAS